MGSSASHGVSDDARCYTKNNQICNFCAKLDSIFIWTPRQASCIKYQRFKNMYGGLWGEAERRNVPYTEVLAPGNWDKATIVRLSGKRLYPPPAEGPAVEARSRKDCFPGGKAGHVWGTEADVETWGDGWYRVWTHGGEGKNKWLWWRHVLLGGMVEEQSFLGSLGGKGGISMLRATDRGWGPTLWGVRD